MSLLAALPWSPLFQGLLDGIGAVLAWLYGLVGNYGVSIIILTVMIRVILLPLGVKQIKSMQAMQAIQPKVKELQKKYKNNKQKAQEETMKLYRESGVNPLGGCLPLLLQFPILISMYAVLRAPEVVPQTADGQVPTGEAEAAYYEIHNNHVPIGSELFQGVVSHQGTNFLGMNLQCSAAQAGNAVPIKDNQGKLLVAEKELRVDGEMVGTSRSSLDCGDGIPAKIPYFVILALMVGTTFYQQRQMTRASPAGAQSSQQQAILKIMPVMFGIFGFTFPAGLVVYWTTSNFWQIGQQAALLRAGHIGPDALERRKQEIANKPPKSGGMFSGMLSRAEEERKRREAASGGSSGSRPSRGSGTGKNISSGRSGAKGSGAKDPGSKGSGSKGSSARGSGVKGSGSSSGGSGAAGRRSGSTGRTQGKGGTGRQGLPKGTPPQRPRPKKPGGDATDGS